MTQRIFFGIYKIIYLYKLLQIHANVEATTKLLEVVSPNMVYNNYNAKLELLSESEIYSMVNILNIIAKIMNIIDVIDYFRLFQIIFL